MFRSIRSAVLLASALVLSIFALAGHACAQPTPAPAPSPGAPADTMVFTPTDAVARAAWDSVGAEPQLSVTVKPSTEDDWLRAPLGDPLLTHPDPWRSRNGTKARRLDVTLDYNRVDLVRPGLWLQVQEPTTMYPRLGARIEYAIGRQHGLYGVQIEQPLLPTARFVAGVNMTRRTDHSELQQVEGVENSLDLLVAREDWRDYFEREGFGAYLSWRVPDFSTVSTHLRRDKFHSLSTNRDTWSVLAKNRALRRNPAIDEGESHTAVVRLERLTRRSLRKRAGLYHWAEVERAGGGMGGDYDYTRALADVRSIVRLSPAVTLALRAAGGAALAGDLPRQKQFVVGGIDGLRAHAFGSFRGDHMALGQAEYSIGLWQLASPGVRGGLHALVFADAGTAWTDAKHGYDVSAQKFAVDGGIGLASADDDVRVYFARNLQRAGADFVVSLRLQRPF